jgi:hypothetical protein
MREKRALNIPPVSDAPVIREFRGRHNFLSNFFPSAIVVDGIRFPTVEHAFAAAKTHDLATKQRIAAAATPGAAKYAGRRVALRADWEAVKNDVMLDLLRTKFTRHPNLGALLLDTGDALLFEGNRWNDRVWGVDARTGEGENRLGQILMQVRGELGGMK